MMDWGKTAVISLLMQWSYCSFALNHRYMAPFHVPFCWDTSIRKWGNWVYSGPALQWSKAPFIISETKCKKSICIPYIFPPLQFEEIRVFSPGIETLSIACHFLVGSFFFLNSLVPGKCGCNFWYVIFKRNYFIDILSIFCKVDLKWMPQKPIGWWASLSALKQQSITWTIVDKVP